MRKGNIFIIISVILFLGLFLQLESVRRNIVFLNEENESLFKQQSKEELRDLEQSSLPDIAEIPSVAGVSYRQYIITDVSCQENREDSPFLKVLFNHSPPLLS